MKTSIYLRPGDAAKLAALGMSASEAVREFCAGRGEDGMPTGKVIRAPRRPAETLAASVKRVIDRRRAIQTPETIAALDPTANDPADVLPDPKPPTPHGWTFTGTLQRQPDGTDRWVGQHIARPSSLDELSRLVSVAPGRVRLGSAHVLIVSEVSDG